MNGGECGMGITSLICRAFGKPLRHSALQNSYPKKKKRQATNIHNNTGVLCSTFRTFTLNDGIEGKNTETGLKRNTKKKKK